MHIYQITSCNMSASTAPTAPTASTAPTAPTASTAPTAPKIKGISKNPRFCPECFRQKKWNDDYAKGNIYCPGAPRVHTCRKRK